MAEHVRNFYASGYPAGRSIPAERQRAYRAVDKAIKSGDLVVPDRCEKCGAEHRPTINGGRWFHAHHADYSRPLDVVFLCVPCHKQLHRKLRTSDG